MATRPPMRPLALYKSYLLTYLLHSVTHRQILKAFIHHSILAGFYTPDYDFEELCNEADYRLFNTVLESQSHVLEQLLPPAFSQSYNFRKRPHIRQNPYRYSYLTVTFSIRCSVRTVTDVVFLSFYVCIMFVKSYVYHFNVGDCCWSIFNKQILLFQ